MAKEKRYYIAYGSNLNIQQMQVRCPEARVIGTSVIPDYELLFKGSKTGSYLTIEPKAGASVPAAVWKVSESDEQTLNRYEGCPTFYYKTTMVLPVKSLHTGKVRRRRVFVYIMHEDRPFGIPSQTYMKTCVDGYHSFGFSVETLTKALSISKKKAGALDE